MASMAALQAFQRQYTNPENDHPRSRFNNKAAEYRYWWAWYNSSALEDLEAWSTYRAKNKLYRQTRIIYNPVRRLVDFYSDNIYPGVLTETNVGVPPGVPIAIPFRKDIDSRLIAAIAQIWEWSRWSAGKSLMVTNAAALGNAFVEIVDSPANGKVYIINRWPGQVVDLELDDVGNVKAYAIEYRAQEDNGKSYIYRKEVDNKTIATFKDGKPYDYDPDDGVPESFPNPYGFVPAVWVPHRHLGGIYGAPCFHGSIAKLEELNSTAALIHDQIRKVVAAPKIMWTDATAEEISAGVKRGSSEDLEYPNSDRETLPMLVGPTGGSIDDLTGNLDLGGAIPYIQELLAEIEKDHPELQMWEEIRKMSQVTGPAAYRLVGDVSNRIYERAANYDRASKALFQMAVAIAGWRLERGDWKNPSAQQEKFRGYDLDSYAQDKLELTILPRPILQASRKDFADEEVQLWMAAAQAVTSAGVPAEFLFQHWEWSQEKIDLFKKLRDEEDERSLQKMADTQQQMAEVATKNAPPTAGAPNQPKQINGGRSAPNQSQSPPKQDKQA